MKYIQNLFRGRVGLLNFWVGLFLPAIVCIPLGLIFEGYNSTFLNLLVVILEVVLLVYYLALITRRLHDNSKSGWFGLTAYIPIYGLYTLFLLFYLLGENKVNKYGAPDKGLNIKSILGMKS